MTREEARRRLYDTDEVSFDLLDEIFRAFGFLSDSTDNRTEVYYHPDWRHCGLFVARDDGEHTLALHQRLRIQGMIDCVRYHEQQAQRPTRGRQP
jgi:hypothetical protein